MGTSLKREQEVSLNTPDTGHSSFFSNQVNLVLIWLVAGSVAFFIALMWLPAVYIDGQYIPAGVDSFYHARRILDEVLQGAFFQFDPKIHAPEGALLTWPWTYDYLIAQIVRIVQFIFNINDPMAIIVYLPPVWTFVNVAILLGIASLLNLSYPLRLIAVLCFAFLPLTQNLHGAGRIDHHFMEHTMVLLTLWAGIQWFKRDKGMRNSILLGLVLGFAIGVNNGLFVLQIPVVLTLAILWVKHELPDQKQIEGFSIALLVSTLLILLPSEPFHRGLNSYYYLSLFHLYVACCSVFAISYMRRQRFNTKNATILSACCFLLLIGMLPQVISGSEFVFAEIQTYKNIPETVNIFKEIYNHGIVSILNSYTGLIIAAPFLLLYLIYTLKNKQDDTFVFFTITCSFGFFMLLLQLRLNYFGSFALYLPLLIIFNNLLEKRSINKKAAWTGLVAILAVAYIPTLTQFSAQTPPGRSFDYALTRAIYPAMKRACDKNPGALLAEYGDGNTIRFHSECSVIANNMVITPKDVEKVLFIEKLMTMTAEQLHKQYPWINYVFVRRKDNIMSNEPSDVVFQKNKGLREELLLRGNNFPSEYKLIKQLKIKLPDGNIIPFARLFAIDNKEN